MDLIDHALRCKKPDSRYAYVAPYYAQAKDVVWLYVKKYALVVPGVTANESELRVDFPGGARIKLYGADNYDRMRGIYLDGVILDEYADQPPQAWREVIRPALSDREGWAVFIGTSKGKNAFYSIYKDSTDNSEWFSLMLKASETGIIPESELSVLRSQMSENEYSREFECNFDAAIEGAYFAKAINEAKQQQRIGLAVAVDKLQPFRAFIDIGGTGARADAFSMWMAQFVGKEIRLVDYYEAIGQEFSDHVHWLRSNGYDNCEVILPHDGANHEKIQRVTYESSFRDAGFKQVRVVKNQGMGAATARIEASRRVFPQCWFDTKTEPGIEALGWYHPKYDEKRQLDLGPEHDWSSHACDAFGLLATYYETEFRPRQQYKTKVDYRQIDRAFI